MTDKIINWLCENLTPEGGAFASIGSFSTGWILGRINPDFISDTLYIAQLTAFFVSILVGIATLYTLHLKWRKARGK